MVQIRKVTSDIHLKELWFNCHLEKCPLMIWKFRADILGSCYIRISSVHAKFSVKTHLFMFSNPMMLELEQAVQYTLHKLYHTLQYRLDLLIVANKSKCVYHIHHFLCVSRCPPWQCLTIYLIKILGTSTDGNYWEIFLLSLTAKIITALDFM